MTTTVWVKVRMRLREGIGPGFPDYEVPDGYDVREEPFEGATECKVTSKEKLNGRSS